MYCTYNRISSIKWNVSSEHGGSSLLVWFGMKVGHILDLSYPSIEGVGSRYSVSANC